ncbi:tRNA dihydrouridine synthase DusB [Candidatus Woesearchaeota archaeon]|nr:tRNA dihydrouridine synthase DusB [Candidatus Woesearchaeota archaeon]
MKIGNLKIDGKLFLAPMCDITNLPFRLLCKRYGAAMMYSEMIHADAFLMGSEKTGKRLYFLEEERPIGIQVIGSREDLIVKAAVRIQKQLKPDLIDINIGCPSYNVTKLGSGAAMLSEPDKIKSLVNKLSDKLKIPLTCKMRVTNNEDKTIKLAGLIQESGAGALTVHGRTAKQGYSGKADWKIIGKIKSALDIPVILNGDVTDELSAARAFEETGCDAVMIGRAALGNPFIFKRISHYLLTGKTIEEQDKEQRIKDFFELVRLCNEHNYEDLAYIKVQASHFTKGIEGGAILRRKITSCKTAGQIVDVLKKN